MPWQNAHNEREAFIDRLVGEGSRDGAWIPCQATRMTWRLRSRATPLRALAQRLPSAEVTPDATSTDLRSFGSLSGSRLAKGRFACIVGRPWRRRCCPAFHEPVRRAALEALQARRRLEAAGSGDARGRPSNRTAALEVGVGLAGGPHASRAGGTVIGRPASAAPIADVGRSSEASASGACPTATTADGPLVAQEASAADDCRSLCGSGGVDSRSTRMTGGCVTMPRPRTYSDSATSGWSAASRCSRRRRAGCRTEVGSRRPPRRGRCRGRRRACRRARLPAGG